MASNSALSPQQKRGAMIFPTSYIAYDWLIESKKGLGSKISKFRAFFVSHASDKYA